MNKVRICPHCKVKPIEKASESYCNDCGRIKTIERQQRFKSACVAHVCAENCDPYGTCSNCKQQFIDAQLCLRHREQSPTNIKISKLTGAVPLRQRVLDELTKCDILCHNCERKIYRSKRPPTKLKTKCLQYLGEVCSDCGCDGPPSALEFHHEDPSRKTIQLGDRGLNYWSEIYEDIKICTIKCANCHSLLHANQKRQERNKYLESVNLMVDNNNNNTYNTNVGTVASKNIEADECKPSQEELSALEPEDTIAKIRKNVVVDTTKPAE